MKSYSPLTMSILLFDGRICVCPVERFTALISSLTIVSPSASAGYEMLTSVWVRLISLSEHEQSIATTNAVAMPADSMYLKILFIFFYK